MEKRVFVITNEPESVALIMQYFERAKIAFEVQTPEQSGRSMEVLYQ